MRAIRSKNTKPELKLHALLEAAGLEFEVHVSDLPGTPDVVLPEHRIAIFVNGCFWHGHDCYLFRMPEDRRDFWQPKIGKTRERDARKWDALLEQGLRVLVIWECAVKGRLRLAEDVLARSVLDWVVADKDSHQYRFHSLRSRPDISDQSGLRISFRLP
jgi:DNA mismatch endonuclease (patch repair protein)